MYSLGVVRGGTVRILAIPSKYLPETENGHLKQDRFKHIDTNTYIIFSMEDDQIYTLTSALEYTEMSTVAYYIFGEFLSLRREKLSEYVMVNFTKSFPHELLKEKMVEGKQLLVERGVETGAIIDFASLGTDVAEQIKRKQSEEKQLLDSLRKQGWEADEHGYWFDNIFIGEEQKRIMDAALSLAKVEPTIMMIKGRSGYGKTTIPHIFAKAHNMNYLRFNCAAVRDPEEWFGTRELKVKTGGTETVFLRTELTEIIEKGNAIIVFDEFNRVEPWLHNTLFPLLDDDHATTIHGERIVCGENILFVATINEGSAYAGTFFMDVALVNRVTLAMSVKALPPYIEEEICRRYGLKEEVCKLLPQKFLSLRRISNEKDWSADVSTRSLHKVCKLLAHTDLEMMVIFDAVIGQHLQETDRKELIDIING
jgi:MoxR-like ATPase